MAWAEWSVLGVVLLLVALRPQRLVTGLGALEAKLSPALAWLLGQPWRAVLAAGLLATALRAAVLPWLGAPKPSVHDEQSLLLQAQTYVAGRLANPTHPFWQHFESFHINQVPAYASMYFPGRGLPLAVGLWLAQEPWVGVWLSMTLMCMAAVWMLQAWVSAPLALLGGVILALRFGVFSYWINAYWGGAFTALGAMLVIGALPRMLPASGKQDGPVELKLGRGKGLVKRLATGLVMGLGALILMTTRPYEGFLICLPVAFALLLAWVRAWARPGFAGADLVAVLPVLLPVLLSVVVGAVMLLAYNQATTGQLSKTPYALNRETYASAPAFLASPPVASAERGPRYFRDFYAEEARPYERRGSLSGWATGLAGKLFHNWSFYLGPLLTLPFLVGLWRVRQNMFVIGTLGFFAAGYALETWNFPHYTAPLVPLLLIVLLNGFAGLRKAGERSLLLARCLPLALALVLLLPLSAVVTGQPQLEINAHSRACCALSDTNFRDQIKAQLLSVPGPHLVLIKDGPHNPLHFELVYNAPDIDRAPIVWARRLSPSQDMALQNYFATRQQWAFEWRPDLPSGYQLDMIARPAAHRPLVQPAVTP